MYALVGFLMVLASAVDGTSFIPIKAVTYNAILTDAAWNKNNLSIPSNRGERLFELIKYLYFSDVDLICLQEVFIGQDIEDLVEALSLDFPYSFSQLHYFNGSMPPQSDGLRAPVCNIVDAYMLLLCIHSAPCNDTHLGLESNICLLTYCTSAFERIILTGGSKCISCMLHASDENRLLKCAASDVDVGLWDMNTMGLLLMSKRPLTQRKAVPFYQGVPQFIQRGYLQAVMDDDITVTCTHLTPANNNSLPMPLFNLLSTFDDQNAYEVKDFLDRHEDAKPGLILGDFNVGPKGDGVKPEKKKRYRLLKDKFNAKPAKECTFCSDNPYNIGDTNDKLDVAIDHIFGNGDVNVASRKVVLKKKDASVWHDGDEYPLSDHYGVEAMVVGPMEFSKKRMY